MKNVSILCAKGHCPNVFINGPRGRRKYCVGHSEEKAHAFKSTRFGSNYNLNESYRKKNRWNW